MAAIKVFRKAAENNVAEIQRLNKAKEIFRRKLNFFLCDRNNMLKFYIIEG
jgi:hypothetical protein